MQVKKSWIFVFLILSSCIVFLSILYFPNDEDHINSKISNKKKSTLNRETSSIPESITQKLSAPVQMSLVKVSQIGQTLTLRAEVKSLMDYENIKAYWNFQKDVLDIQSHSQLDSINLKGGESQSFEATFEIKEKTSPGIYFTLSSQQKGKSFSLRQSYYVNKEQQRKMKIKSLNKRRIQYKKSLK